MTTEAASHGMEGAFGFLPQLQHSITSKRSTRVVDLLDRPEELDFDALNVFFRFGSFIGDDTPFKYVKHLSPSVAIAPPVHLPRDRAMDAYIDLFRQAVLRRADPNAVLALSGGRDSRHILLELWRSGKRPKYALTLDDNPEATEIARTLAGRCGVKHVIVARGPMSTAAEIYKNFETNFNSLQHAWLTSVAYQRDESAWWDGIAGDMLSQPRRLQEWNLSLFEHGRLDELTERVVLDGPVPLIRDQALFPRQAALARVREEIEKHKDAPNPVGSLYFWTRTRRNIAPAAFLLLRPAAQTVLAPYLDTDVWALLAGLPARMLLDHKFHSDTIARAFPEFVGVPYASQVEVRPSRFEALAQAADLARYSIHNSLISQLAVLARIGMVIAGLRPSSTTEWLRTHAVYVSELARLAENPVEGRDAYRRARSSLAHLKRS